MDRRLVSFKDETIGKATSWKWDFGDGSVSTEQNPIHRYARGGDYVVVLEVAGRGNFQTREDLGCRCQMIATVLAGILVLCFLPERAAAQCPADFLDAGELSAAVSPAGIRS